ncbi:hypothetical protein K0M31_017827, partial [Melipona bicolor]
TRYGGNEKSKSWSKSRKGAGNGYRWNCRRIDPVEPGRLGSFVELRNESETYRCASAEFFGRKSAGVKGNTVTLLLGFRVSRKWTRFTEIGASLGTRPPLRNSIARLPGNLVLLFQKEVPELTPFEVVFHSKYRPSITGSLSVASSLVSSMDSLSKNPSPSIRS